MDCLMVENWFSYAGHVSRRGGADYNSDPPRAVFLVTLIPPLPILVREDCWRILPPLPSFVHCYGPLQSSFDRFWQLGRTAGGQHHPPPPSESGVFDCPICSLRRHVSIISNKFIMHINSPPPHPIYLPSARHSTPTSPCIVVYPEFLKPDPASKF